VVRALGWSDSVFLLSAESTLRDQRYRLFLPRGEYRFTATPPPSALGLPTTRTDPIMIAADSTIDLSVTGNPVSGSVLLGAIPLAGATVLAQSGDVSARDTTRSDGSYTLFLPSGNYSFRVYPGREDLYIMPRSYGASISGPQSIPLDLSGTDWTGTVRSATDSTVVPAVDVRAVDSFSFDSGVSTTDMAGMFHVVLQSGRTFEIQLSSTSSGIIPRQIHGIPAGADSTFDLFVTPANP
jgi:hypothetical protein